MTHVLQVLFLSVFFLQVVMHGEESQVPGDLRQSEILKSFEPLDCSTKNVICGIECTLCGLLYVGETRQTL
jgi:hypothetical protein